MSKFKFEVFITKGEDQKAFVLDEKPIVFGSASSCDISIPGEGPKLKVMLQREEDHLLVKVYDLKHPVILNGKKYKSAKLKKSTFFKISDFDIILNIEEVKEFVEEKVDLTEGDELLDYDDDAATVEQPGGLPQPPVTQLPTPVIIEEEVTKTQITATPELSESINEINAKVEQTRRVIKKENKAKITPVVSDEGFSFNIEFDENNFKKEQYQSFQNPNLDFSSYIDLKDETIKELPTPEIHKESKTQSVHVVHMNNGTSLNDKFFPIDFKRVFLSNSAGGKNYFQAHDCDSTKEEFLYSRDNTVFVVCLPGYTMHRSVDNQLVELTDKTISIASGERIVLTKGTSQIVIQLSATPAKIKTNKFFNVEEQMLKSVAISCSFALFILALVVAFPAKKEEKIKKEMVIIYKRQKVEKIQKKPTPPSQDVAKSEVDKETPKKKPTKPAPKPKAKVVKKTPPKPVKKITKVTPKKTPIKKVSKAAPKKIRRKVVKVAKRKAPAPTPKKKFKFNFGSKMNSMVSKTSNTQLKAAKGARNVDIASSVSSASSVTSDFNTSKFGKSNNKVARFAAGKRAGKNSAVGTRGLSGKTKSTTAYIEANTKILGAMDPELIRKLMREYIPQFRHCYQRELLINPSIAGVFDLAFQINARGVGVNVGVQSGGKRFSKKAMGCLKKVVSLIRFPKPKGGGLVDVKQPMNFFKQ